MLLNTVSAVSLAAASPITQEPLAFRRKTGATGQDHLPHSLLQAANDSFSHSNQKHPDSEPQLERSGALTLETVMNRIERQQGKILPTDIQDIIVSNFPVKDHRLAALVLEKMTRFASMKNLNDLQGRLVDLDKNTKQDFYYEKEGSLGSILDYLAQKYEYSRTEKKSLALDSPFRKNVVTKQELNLLERGSILLDSVTLDQISQSSDLRKHIAKQKLTLLYPQGWDEGINPFNQLSIEATAVKLARLMSIAKQLQNDQKLSEDEAAEQALCKPTLDLLTQLGLNQQVEILLPLAKVPEPETQPGHFPPSAKTAKQLAPISISKDELKQILENFQDPLHQQAALNLLAEQAEIYSPLRLSLSAQALHLKILKYAKKYQIPTERVFYYIPKESKSYGLISANHLMVNEIAFGQLTEDPSDIPNAAESLLVILDDIAGSGCSLLAAKEYARTEGFSGKILMAPIVLTQMAQKLFEDERQKELNGEDLDSNQEFLTAHSVQTFSHHPAYQSLPNHLKETLKQIIGNSGFNENGLSIAFPYMAPDNNNAFFAQKIAPYFLLNRAGSKYSEYNYPSKGYGPSFYSGAKEYGDAELEESDWRSSSSDDEKPKPTKTAAKSFEMMKKSAAQMNLCDQAF